MKAREDPDKSEKGEHSQESSESEPTYLFNTTYTSQKESINE